MSLIAILVIAFPGSIWATFAIDHPWILVTTAFIAEFLANAGSIRRRK